MTLDGFRILAAALLPLVAGCPGDLAVRDARPADATRDLAADDTARGDTGQRDTARPCPPLAQLAGSYQGTFTGTLSGALSGAISGTVAFTLVKQGTDEFLTIGGGKLVGTAQGLYPYTADLEGTVKCDQIDALITHGKVLALSFDGAMSGTWSAGGINDGKWNGHDTGGSVQGDGSWTAAKQ